MATKIISIVQITLSNSGGELDSTIVEVTAGNSSANPVKAALMEMLAGIDLDAGDTITVREV